MGGVEISSYYFFYALRFSPCRRNRMRWTSNFVQLTDWNIFASVCRLWSANTDENVVKTTWDSTWQYIVILLPRRFPASWTSSTTERTKQSQVSHLWSPERAADKQGRCDLCKTFRLYVCQGAPAGPPSWTIQLEEIFSRKQYGIVLKICSVPQCPRWWLTQRGIVTISQIRFY